MKLWICFFTVLIIASCTKHQNLDCDQFWIQKAYIEWKIKTRCSDSFKYVLNKATFQSQTVYYTTIECFYCKFAPPEYVYDCKNNKIPVKNWNLVTNNMVLARCTDFAYPH